MKKIKVMVPVSEVKFGEIKMAERTRDLNGRVVGLMWNGKPNGDLLLKYLEEAFKRTFRLSEVLMQEKDLPSSGAPAEILELLSAKCDLVILAIGD